MDAIQPEKTVTVLNVCLVVRVDLNILTTKGIVIQKIREVICSRWIRMVIMKTTVAIEIWKNN